MVEHYSYIYDTLTCSAHQYTCIYSLQNFKGRVIRQYYKKSYFCVKFDQIIISVSLMWSYFRKIQLSKFLVTYLIIFFFKPLTHGLYFVTITIWWWEGGGCILLRSWLSHGPLFYLGSLFFSIMGSTCMSFIKWSLFNRWFCNFFEILSSTLSLLVFLRCLTHSLFIHMKPLKH